MLKYLLSALLRLTSKPLKSYGIIAPRSWELNIHCGGEMKGENWTVVTKDPFINLETSWCTFNCTSSLEIISHMCTTISSFPRQISPEEVGVIGNVVSQCALLINVESFGSFTGSFDRNVTTADDRTIIYIQLVHFLLGRWLSRTRASSKVAPDL